jgi:hypothetical protein
VPPSSILWLRRDLRRGDLPSLGADIAAYNGRLRVREGDPVTVLPQLAAEVGAGSPYAVGAGSIRNGEGTPYNNGTVSCELLSGDASPGTIWHKVSKFAGRTVDLDYRLESVTETGFVIVGRNETTSPDTTTVVPDGSGSSVDRL